MKSLLFEREALLSLAAAYFSRIASEEEFITLQAEYRNSDYASETLSEALLSFPSFDSYASFCREILTPGIPTQALPVESLHTDHLGLPLDSHQVRSGYAGTAHDAMSNLFESLQITLPNRYASQADHLSAELELIVLCLQLTREESSLLDRTSATSLASSANTDSANGRSHALALACNLASMRLAWVGAYRKRLECVSDHLHPQSKEAFSFALQLLLALEEINHIALQTEGGNA